jgi:DNA-nicking Smr family endonuclease
MTPGSRGRNQSLDAEDAALWAHIAAQVRPLRRRAATATRTKRPKAEAPLPVKTPAATKTVSPAPSRTEPVLRPLAPDARERLPRTDERKLRRGTVAIGGRLDLHGMTRAEAHRAVVRFLTALVERGERVALIITGKGGRKGAEGELSPGVLRGEFPRWITDGALARIVLAWRPAAAQHGGDGAFYVLLRRPGR